MGYMDYVEVMGTYKTFHLNKTNLKIHFVCVPHIMWALMAILALKGWTIGSFEINFEKILFYSVVPYWTLLNWKVCIGMLAFTVPVHIHV